ncbi:uncharacterized protein LOC141607283 [Silene latifolia]|uniref:uncharacterized protein LOC141607283 n=1 Tax=Silene latifolia TaxID=37657 RepID=UPI003D789B89
MSKGKFNAYFNGIKSDLRQEVLQISGMVEGSMPFKYLGVPIKTTRLKLQDCKPLIDKIVQKIRNLGARKLSYAGRLVLVQSVLNTLYNYWASMFILPQGVINKIESICRNFLWDGGVDYKRTPLISWEKICKPKIEGGLGLKQDTLWNQTAVGKLVWWIASKSDHLWVKWVNQIYIKGGEWLDYCPSPNSSWAWRKICQIKDILCSHYQKQVWTQDKPYSIARGYELLRTIGERLDWTALVWNKLTIPKHGFLSWMYHHDSLNTNAKLHRLGIIEDDTYYVCGLEAESSQHLFFECIYSKQVLQYVEILIGIPFPSQDAGNWRLAMTGTDLWKDVINAYYNACIYHIWKQRNQAKHEHTILHPQKLASLIGREMKTRILSSPLILMGNRDRSLVERIQQAQT